MPAPRLIGETCLRALDVAAVRTAAGAALNPYQRRAARGLQSLKGENVRHKLPPFFCDSPAIKSAGNSKRRAAIGLANVGLRERMICGNKRRSRRQRSEDLWSCPCIVMIRNLRTVLQALLVPFFKEVVLEPLHAFHLSKKFVGRVLVVQIGRDLFFSFTSKKPT